MRVSEEEIVVRPKRGGTIRGRVRTPDDVVLDSLSLWPFGAVGGVFIEEEPLAGSFRWTSDVENKTFEVVGVPPGTWSVWVWGDQGEKHYEGDVEAAPGDEVVVDLR